MTGQMAENMQEIGQKIIWMARVIILGQMEDLIKENIKWIKKKDMVFILGY